MKLKKDTIKYTKLNQQSKNNNSDVLAVEENIATLEQKVEKLLNKNKSDGVEGAQHTEPDLVWRDPIPVEQHSLFPVKPFCRMLLPIPVRDYTLDHATRMDNTPPDFTAIGIVIALAALAGGNVYIRPKKHDKSWKISLTLWGAAIGSASTKKTPSLGAGLSLLRHAQDTKLTPRAEREKTLHRLKSSLYEKKLEELERAAKRALEEGDEQEAIKLADQITNLGKPPEPYNRHVFISDCTTEALAVRLQANAAGILLNRDELAGWLASMGSSGREHERAFYLECWNGSDTPYVQERISRENLYLDRTVLSILGGIQPRLLKKVLIEKVEGAGDDGLFERLVQLSVYPDHHNSDTTDVAEKPHLRKRAQLVFEKVSQLDSPLDPISFSFDTEAQKVWDKWSNEMVEKEKSVPELWRSVFGKYPSLCAKLSLTFHLIEEADTCDDESFKPALRVGKRDITRAIFWVNYLISHFRRIAMLAVKEKQQSSEYALASKLKLLYPSFTRQVLSSKNWSNLNSKENREQAIRALLDRGHIQELNKPRRFVIHPKYAPK